VNANDLDPAVEYIFTIGHSNTAIDVLLDNLREYGIEALVDVRSQPVSRFVPHFNRRALEQTLPKHDIQYIFMGDSLGGRPSDVSAYDADGHVRYDVVSASEGFQSGINDLVDVSRTARTALMCSEEDPRKCHRSLLIARTLRSMGTDGATIIHIRRTGNAESDGEVAGQLDLFAAPWRSPQPLAHKRRTRAKAPA
jgi:uncharacterized protein (DUF488 family)